MNKRTVASGLSSVYLLNHTALITIICGFFCTYIRLRIFSVGEDLAKIKFARLRTSHNYVKIFWWPTSVLKAQEFLLSYRSLIQNNSVEHPRVPQLKQWKPRSDFHRLLLVLCVSDLCLIVCCLAIHGLNGIWSTFEMSYWPALASWILPIAQISMQMSVYATVIISVERYVRILYICNLKHCRFFNEDNFK